MTSRKKPAKRKARGRWMTLPMYSRKLHFFTPGASPEAARPSLCPQFYSTFRSKIVRNPNEAAKCKTCKDRLATLSPTKPRSGK